MNKHQIDCTVSAEDGAHSLQAGSLSAALLLQQQLGPRNNQTATSASSAAAAALASSGIAGRNIDSSLQAQALLKHQEDQLRMARLLLQQRQVEDLFTAGSASSATNTLLQNQLLLQGVGGANNPSIGPPSIDPAVALIQSRSQGDVSNAQGMLDAMASRQLMGNQGVLISNQAQGLQSSPESQISPQELERNGEDHGDSEKNEQSESNNAEDNVNPDAEEEDDDEYYKEGSDDTSNGAIRASNETFPLKLYRMIIEAEKNGQADIVSFFAHGRAFAIHKPRDFVSEVMSKYFTTSRMSSFQRQLNLYGFRRITEGRDKGGYFHEHFLKGRRSLCKKIKRKRATVKAPPNFFNTTNSLTAQPSAFGATVSQELLRSHLMGTLNAATAGLTDASLLDMARQGLINDASRNSLQQGVYAELSRNDLSQGLLTDVVARSAAASTLQPQLGLTAAAAHANGLNQPAMDQYKQELMLQQLRQRQLQNQLLGMDMK